MYKPITRWSFDVCLSAVAMDQRRPKPFPLSRYMYYDSFRHYYPFGNSPAEDFLRSVPGSENPTTLLRPAVLSLACGDISSCMYTLWKNFGMDGESCSTFKGVDFVLNDDSACVLARNVLFLYLCLQMPEYDQKKLEREWLAWIASLWAIWYNHELAPLHNYVFTSALEQLLEWSETPTRWERCPLGNKVSFSSLTTVKEIKNVWALWAGTVEGFRVTSVRAMKKERKSYQAFYFPKHFTNKKLEISEMIKSISTWRCNYYNTVYTPERVEAMVQESCAYLEGGTAYAEKVLGLQLPSSHVTIVNKTFYQQADGSYSLHYNLDPYTAFGHFVLYSPTEVCQMMLDDQISIQALPVSDEYFRATPLLANSIQQFGMWITTTANILKQSDKCRVSFTFDCSEAVGFCQTLFKFPDQYWEGVGILKLSKFDAIFSSNVIDSLMPGSVLVVTAARLLKLNAALFTTTITHSRKTEDKTMFVFIERLFGLIPELLPVVLGIRCIGNDGKYSSTTKIQPIPSVIYSTESISLPSTVTLIWKNISSHPLVIQSLTNEPHFTQYLLKICKVMVCYWSAVDAFFAIADCFITNLNTDTPFYHFWEPLCKQIVADPYFKRHLIQMQTQSFLHGFHMHITVTEKSCPLCSGHELEDYIGAYSISVSVSVIKKYDESTFALHLYFTPYIDFAIITSLVGSTIDSELQLDFFFPKQEFSRCKKYEIFKHISPFIVQRGDIQNISSTSWKYQFLKNQKLTSCLPIQSSMCKIIRHIGKSSHFETKLSLSDEFLQALEMSKLEVGNVESGERKLKLTCGKEIQMTIVYPYPIHTNVSTKVFKERKIITIRVERAIHHFYMEEPTLYFDLHNPLTLPKLCNERLIMQQFKQQVVLKTIDTAVVLCSKDIFEYLATHASNKYFVIEFCNRNSISVENMMIVVHNVHMNPYFQTPMVSLSYCFPQSFDNVIKLSLTSSWFKLTNGTWSQISVDERQLKCIKRAFLHFNNSTRTNLKSEIYFPVASHSLQQYFYHTLIHPLYPNTELYNVKSAVKRFLSFAAEKKGKKFHTFLSVDSVQHEKEIVSTSTELQSQSNKECANCKKAQPNLKKCGACDKVQYCSKECQRAHWNEHKSNCKQSSTVPTATQTSCAQCKKQCICTPCSCRSVFYCSAECQRLDWPLHKDKCTSTPSAGSKNTSNEAISGSISSIEKKNQDTKGIEEGAIKPLESSAIHGSTHSLDSIQQHTSSMTGICSYCKKEHFAMKHRCGCGKVQYCGKECETKDWKEHKLVCLLSSTNTSTHLSEMSTSTTSVKSKHVSNEPATESTFSQEQEKLDSQEQEILDFQEQETLDSQDQETLDSQEQETLDSQEQETLDSQEQQTLDSEDTEKEESLDSQEQESLDSEEMEKEQETLDSQEQQTLDSQEQETLDSEDTEKEESLDSQEQESLDSEETEKEQETLDSQEEESLDSQDQETLDSQELEKLDSQEQETLDSQEQETLDFREQETLDSQEQETLDSQKQDTLDSQAQETLDYQEQEMLDYQEQEMLDSQEQEALDSQNQETLDSQEQETLDSQEQETLGSQEKVTMDSEKDKETATSSTLLSAPTGKPQDEKQICSRCKKTSSTLHQCSCHKVSYCTVECQRLDWPKHKDVCKNTSLAV